MLLHAVTDALLGAAGLGDIGELFPDTAAANRGRDSAEMLGQVVGRVQQAGYRAVNVDCIVFAEQPKLSAYKEAIRRRIAELVQVEPGAVGIKAKTGEEVGPVGRREAIVAECVVLLAERQADLFGYAAIAKDEVLCAKELRSVKPIYRLTRSDRRKIFTSFRSREPHRPCRSASTTRCRRPRNRSSRSRRAKWASISAARRSTSRATSATWSGR